MYVFEICLYWWLNSLKNEISWNKKWDNVKIGLFSLKSERIGKNRGIVKVKLCLSSV